jgi:hypothetical protein
MPARRREKDKRRTVFTSVRGDNGFDIETVYA